MSKVVEEKVITLFNKISKIWTPPPTLKISQWAENYRKLSLESSVEAGNWRNDRAPYQIDIMDSVNDENVTKIVVMSSAQVGKTEILLNILGYYIDYDPASIMYVLPTLNLAESFSKDRLAPMIRDTPVLRQKIKDAKSRDSDNTILHKKFLGGQLTIVGANSPSDLSSRPIRIVLCDEVDRYPKSVGTEGDPIGLAEKRTTTFWNRKIIIVSTPTIKGISKIEREFNDSSAAYWCLPCPHCGKYQPLDFERIIFNTVSMRCENCGKDSTEKQWKSGEGRWIETNNNPTVKGFHLNELASPWRNWSDIISDFKKANEKYKRDHDTTQLQNFINTSLGKSWELRDEGIYEDNNDLMERREFYAADLPDGVIVLTAGVDVQNDRLEVEVVGWGYKHESWGIEYRKIYGNPAKEEVWNELEKFLETEFFFAKGNSLLIAATCIDTGGSFTTETYKFLKEMEKKRKRIYGIKGMGGDGIPLVYKATKNNNEKVNIFILGVNAGKEQLMSRLNIQEVGAGYCHFPNNEERGYDSIYMKGLTSEQRVYKEVNGKPQIKWVKKSGVRNEPLDIRNYATAALEILKPNMSALEKYIQSGLNYMQKSTKKQPKKVRKSSGGIEL